MKLILVLSIIAYGYADKLDRTYLPPANAASSGGSPGSLTAPGVQPEAFGQGLPVSGRQPVLSGFGKPISSQNGLSGKSQNSPESANFGGTFNPSGVENTAGVSGSGYGPSTGISASSGFNNPTPSAIQQQQFSSNGFSDSNQNLPSSGGQSTSGSFNQGFGQGEQGLNGVAQVYNQERPQAAAERNAETLKYINENNGETYSYSYETSNGISAEESGVATNGVMAQGGYAYTGDDGKAYSVSYTADENGYQPQGEHLPTPHPIPEEILKSIEENAKAAAAGIQEGAYQPEEYESAISPQQYNIGSSASYQSKPGQEQSQGPSYNPTQTNQYQATNQQIREQNIFGQSGQNGPVSQQYNKDTVSVQGFGQSNQGQIHQNNQGLTQKSSQSYRPRPSQFQTQSIVSGQFTNQSPTRGAFNQNIGPLTQDQGSGYQYNQPQNVFQPTTFTQGSANQYHPQAGSKGQNTLPSGPSVSGSELKKNQNTIKPSFGNRPSTDVYGTQQYQSQSQVGSGQQTTSANRPLPQSGLNKPQNQITAFRKQGQENQNNQPFGLHQSKSAGQGYQYQPKQPSLGFNKPSLIKNSGSQNEGISNQPSFNYNNRQQQGPQSSFYESSHPQLQQSGKQQSFGPSDGPRQNSQSFNTFQNGASVNNQAGSPQFSQKANRPSFNYNQAPNKISQYQQSGNQPSFGNRQPVQGSQLPSGGQGFGTNTLGQGSTAGSRPVQAPYQYNKLSQSFRNQDRSEDFGGPREPPSFSSQEGYKY